MIGAISFHCIPAMALMLPFPEINKKSKRNSSKIKIEEKYNPIEISVIELKSFKTVQEKSTSLESITEQKMVRLKLMQDLS